MLIAIEILELIVWLAGITLILGGLCGIFFILGCQLNWSSTRHDIMRRCGHKDKIYTEGKYKWKCINCGYKKKQ